MYFTSMINLKLPFESSLTYLFIKLFVIIRETRQRISGMIMDANLNLYDSISFLFQEREKICPGDCNLVISSILQHFTVIHAKIHQFISYPSEDRIPENATFLSLRRERNRHQQASQAQDENFCFHVNNHEIISKIYGLFCQVYCIQEYKC